MKMESKMNHKDTVSLRDYFDSRFTELIKYIDVKFNSMETSTCLAQDNLNTRLEGMNEFRNSLKDQTAQFITRTEHESLITKYDADIRVLREQNAENRGKASMQSVYISYAFALIAIIMGLVGLIFKS